MEKPFEEYSDGPKEPCMRHGYVLAPPGEYDQQSTETVQRPYPRDQTVTAKIHVAIQHLDQSYISTAIRGGVITSPP